MVIFNSYVKLPEGIQFWVTVETFQVRRLSKTAFQILTTIYNINMQTRATNDHNNSTNDINNISDKSSNTCINQSHSNDSIPRIMMLILFRR